LLLVIPIALQSQGLLNLSEMCLQLVEGLGTGPFGEVDRGTRGIGLGNMQTTNTITIKKGPEERRNEEKRMERANGRGVFQSLLSVSGNGVHAFKDLFGCVARVTTELEDKFVKAKFAINVEVKKM
jgi:hypothetical protein